MPLFLAMLREETAASPELRAAALKGLAAYQGAPRRDPPQLPPPRDRQGRVSLIDYDGKGPPIVFIPSLINPPFILDLAEEVSLLRWLSARGHRCLLVDWGTPGKADGEQDLDRHITDLLLPLIDRLEEPPLLVGYCLGGTIAAAAAALRPVRGLAMIAAPWRFRGYGDSARAAMARLWVDSLPACKRLGLLPMEVLQSGFWRLDPARTVRKYAQFGAMEPDSPAARRFVALEDWANGGAPLTLGVGRQLFDRMILRDQPGLGRWWIAGTRILPHRLACPAAQFVSAHDRIVPAATAGRLLDSRILGAGHVGMIMGSTAKQQLWEPLHDWLSAASAPR